MEPVGEVGDYRYEGADLGILITRGRLMTRDFILNERAHRWIDGIRANYAAIPLEEIQPATAAPVAGAFKIL